MEAQVNQQRLSNPRDKELVSLDKLKNELNKTELQNQAKRDQEFKTVMHWLKIFLFALLPIALLITFLILCFYEYKTQTPVKIRSDLESILNNIFCAVAGLVLTKFAEKL